MPITEAQRALRRKHIGASDMAAIMGLDPYRSAYDVWLDKTGKLVDDDKANESMLAGTRFESGVLDFARERLGAIVRNQYRSCPRLHLGANIDALAVAFDPEEPIEGKTGGLFGPLTEHWGDAGTDEVPDRVIVQSHVHMLCLDNGQKTPKCHIAAFLGGRGFAMFQVPRNENLCEAIAEASVHFWQQHVLADVPPEKSMPHLDVIRKVRRQPNKIVPVDASLVKQHELAKAARLEAAKIEDGAKAALIAALGDAEAGDYGDPAKIVTFNASVSRRLDGKRLREERPDVAAEFMVESTSRTLRVQKRPKAG